MPTLLWYPYCLYYYYILTRFKILVPVLLWYSECLSYSYIHSAYLIMIFIKNSQKKLICAFFITIYRVPALLLYVECLLYYNLPYLPIHLLTLSSISINFGWKTHWLIGKINTSTNLQRKKWRLNNTCWK